MKIGADTGFFIALIANAQNAKDYWNQIVAGHSSLVISVLTIHELFVYFYKRGKGELAAEWLALLHTLTNIQIVTVTESIAQQSANYRYGLGMPTVDSIIMTTFLLNNCDLVLSRDTDFERAARQNIIKLELI